MSRTPQSEKIVQRGKQLALALVRAREASPLTQADVAQRAELSLDAIRRIEQGRVPNPSFFTVFDIARATGTTLTRLLNDAGITERSPRIPRAK